jgi:hypothetical protein
MKIRVMTNMMIALFRRNPMTFLTYQRKLDAKEENQTTPNMMNILK